MCIVDTKTTYRKQDAEGVPNKSEATLKEVAVISYYFAELTFCLIMRVISWQSFKIRAVNSAKLADKRK